MDTVRPDASGRSPWHAGLALDASGSLPKLVRTAGCRTWSMFWRNLRAEQVKEAHALGLAVLPWTINDPADMGRLIDMGVDGIVTDYPDRLRAVMTSKGLALP
jgi:glycerophosphoryl diester phosphodiesterase